MLRLIIVLFSMAVLLSGPGAYADTIFFANLTNSQEVPPAAPLLTSTGAPRPASFGTATFILNDAMTALVLTATIFNIDVTGSQTADTFDNLVAAHIHAPAPVGTNASVRWGFFGTPDNDINPDDLVLVPFPSGVGGTFASKWDAPEGNGGTTLAEQLPSILAGLSYINFHTVQFPGGEIRGQILKVSEPAAFILLGIGLLVLRMIASRWQKRML
jgi:CHRD domain-containing protein